MAKKDQMVLFDLTPGRRRPRLPKSPPHNGTDTSRAAARSVKAAAPTIADNVLVLIQEQGGLTCWEVEQHTDLKHQTASARIWELRQAGLIKDSGVKRKTASGRNAKVWIAN